MFMEYLGFILIIIDVCELGLFRVGELMNIGYLEWLYSYMLFVFWFKMRLRLIFLCVCLI